MESGAGGPAVAAIRDAAMRLFAERGFSAVTVRDIAAQAGVSPALVIHDFGTKAKLKESVDQHALDLLGTIFTADPAARTGATSFPAMTDVLADLLEQHPTLMPYLRRLLVDGGPAADALFRTLLDGTRATLDSLEQAGDLLPAEDAVGRAAFLLVNDLGVLILREQLHTALGFDPLIQPGALRWNAVVGEVYRGTVYPAEPH